jgi:hypothetical protein
MVLLSQIISSAIADINSLDVPSLRGSISFCTKNRARILWLIKELSTDTGDWTDNERRVSIIVTERAQAEVKILDAVLEKLLKNK